jgi:hypothetical protein
VSGPPRRWAYPRCSGPPTCSRSFGSRHPRDTARSWASRPSNTSRPTPTAYPCVNAPSRPSTLLLESDHQPGFQRHLCESDSCHLCQPGNVLPIIPDFTRNADRIPSESAIEWCRNADRIPSEYAESDRSLLLALPSVLLGANARRLPSPSTRSHSAESARRGLGLALEDAALQQLVFVGPVAPTSPPLDLQGGTAVARSRRAGWAVRRRPGGNSHSRGRR